MDLSNGGESTPLVTSPASARPRASCKTTRSVPSGVECRITEARASSTESMRIPERCMSQRTTRVSSTQGLNRQVAKNAKTALRKEMGMNHQEHQDHEGDRPPARNGVFEPDLVPL